VERWGRKIQNAVETLENLWGSDREILRIAKFEKIRI
jgi:hypothetical protein